MRSREWHLWLGLLLGGSKSPDTAVRAALCDVTAAVQLDLCEPKGDHSIHVLSQRKVAPRPGFTFHWTSRLPAEEIVCVGGIPVTDHIRTFIDLCDTKPGKAPWIYRRGCRNGLYDPESVIKRLERESRQGRGGLCLAREIVAATSETAHLAKSGKEDHYFNLLVDAGYPPPLRNHRTPSSYGFEWEIDLFYPQKQTGIEVSPYIHHGEPTVYERDGLKELDLKALGISLITIRDGVSDEELLRQLRLILGPPYLFKEDDAG